MVNLSRTPYLYLLWDQSARDHTHPRHMALLLDLPGERVESHWLGKYEGKQSLPFCCPILKQSWCWDGGAGRVRVVHKMHKTNITMLYQDST